MKNEEIKEVFDIEVKRFYLPVVVKDKCPNCDGEISQNLEDQYLSYPTLNKADDITLVCEACDMEFQVPFTLRMSIDIGDLKEN